MQIVPCPECGAPAELEEVAAWPGGDGLVAHARVRCLYGHWFLAASDLLLPGVAGQPAWRT